MLPRYLIGRIQERDLDRILEIEAASFGKDAYDRKLFAEYLRKCGDLFLEASKGRKLCGYSLTRISADGRRAELISIAVDPLYRREGVAAAMLESTIRRLRRRHVASFRLMVKVTNRGAIRFYEKYGFTQVRRVAKYYEDGRDGVRMVKDLGPQMNADERR